MFKFIRLIMPSVIIVLMFSIHSIFASQLDLKVEIKVIKHSFLKAKLKSLSKEIEKTAKLYTTLNQKSYWEIKGKKNFLSLLRSEGYYSSSIDVESSNKAVNLIIFHITPWQRYKLTNIKIKHSESSNALISLPKIEGFRIKEGQYAIANNVISIQNDILNKIEKDNCLLSLEVSHTATINHFDNTVDVTYIVDAGSKASIEKIEYKGLKKVKEEYVHNIIGLTKGQCFKQSYIQKARGELQKSGLFASTNPTIPEKTNENGSVPIIFNLTERRFRSVKSGFSYGTDLGLGIKLGWENRNFFGGG